MQRMPKKLLCLLGSVCIAALLVYSLYMYQEIVRRYRSIFRPGRQIGDGDCTIPRLLEALRPLINGSSRLPIVCLGRQCQRAYARHLIRPDHFPVPKIRHILWRSHLATESQVEKLRSWIRLHPDWLYVLWRDSDLEPFVAAFFPGLLAMFVGLPHHMMRVDMFRYMLLYKYGGTYADFDYSILKSLDEFRRYPAVITQEPEAHALQILGANWPLRVLASPAFMMSAPGHAFFHFALHQLAGRDPSDGLLNFAGPVGLAVMLETYACQFQLAHGPMDAVYVPPSFSFFPYPGNRLSSCPVPYTQQRILEMKASCRGLSSIRVLHERLAAFCADPDSMELITDSSPTVYALHERNKSEPAIYDTHGIFPISQNLTDVRLLFKNLLLAPEFVDRNA